MLSTKQGKGASQPTLYQVVIDDIMESIQSGAFSFDHPICTESKLMEKYNISRITARRAMTELENKGILYRKRGVGSFVSRDIYQKEAQPQAVSSLFAFIYPFNISRRQRYQEHFAFKPDVYHRGYHLRAGAGADVQRDPPQAV